MPHRVPEKVKQVLIGREPFLPKTYEPPATGRRIMAATILLVEDDPDTLEILQLYLAHDGYHSVVAIDGVETLKNNQEFHPDLIILDLVTQGLKGPEVCQYLRQQFWAPVIVLTSQSAEDKRLIAQNLDAAGYISKPFSPREVIRQVNAVLNSLEYCVERSSGYLRKGNHPQFDAHLVLTSTGPKKNAGRYSRRLLQRLLPRRIDLRMAMIGRQRGRVKA
jgi:CheY-like chemotaxis protein